MKRVAVIGAGLMGSGIALEYALGGMEVRIITSRPETAARALETIREELALLVSEGLVEDAAARAAEGRVRAATGLADALADADLAVESAPEDLALKQKLFREIDALAPAHAILASNTSALSITAIASATGRPQQVVGTHYWNPPHLMPLVEVVSGERTAHDTVEQICAVLTGLGKTPIRVRKDVPGFVWNRLQNALLREAMWLLENGVVTPEELDIVGKKGLGRRLFTTGHCEAIDLGGLDTWAKVHEYMLNYISSSTEVSPVLKEKVARGELGAKTGKGFYTWTPERLREAREARNRQLIAWLREDRACPDGHSRRARQAGSSSTR
ncbi:MAG: 3-hydroxyacyl-CoA dehydrogenase family protein [Bacteroidetes bacterium]|nr:3-hydroxyacyl-CoA dehydrogenase family protein [Bacteroidota bacterium]MCL5025604.1 3-hydroxyacyl-CoA dehydrogenase family protein [Chloroflexota bacterium]